MPHFPRNRSASSRPSRLARTAALGVLSLAAGGLLVACGGDDSSATGNPTTTTLSSPSPSPAPSKSASPQASAAPAPSAESSSGAAEQPRAVPSNFPGPTEVPISPRAQGFLDALKKEGITPAADGAVSVATADYICAAQQQGSSNEEITTIVTAAVGSEASAAGKDLSVEQAGKNAQIYIRVAQTTYCNK